MPTINTTIQINFQMSILVPSAFHSCSGNRPGAHAQKNLILTRKPAVAGVRAENHYAGF
jgi:hypothetical protein